MPSCIILQSTHHLRRPLIRRSFPSLDLILELSEGANIYSRCYVYPKSSVTQYISTTTTECRSIPAKNNSICSRIRNFSSESSESSLPKRRIKFMPIKAAVSLTPKSRQYLKLLIDNSPKGKEQTKGIMLNYEQGSDGTPRMMFTFKFLTMAYKTADLDEPVSLEVLDDGFTPKPPKDAMQDGLPKLYINQNCLLKVLGSTVDVDDQYNLVLRDADGNTLDPNNA